MELRLYLIFTVEKVFIVSVSSNP